MTNRHECSWEILMKVFIHSPQPFTRRKQRELFKSLGKGCSNIGKRRFTRHKDSKDSLDRTRDIWLSAGNGLKVTHICVSGKLSCKEQGARSKEQGARSKEQGARSKDIHMSVSTLVHPHPHTHTRSKATTRRRCFQQPFCQTLQHRAAFIILVPRCARYF